MADSVMQRHPLLAAKWAYEWGVVLKGIEQVWQKTGQQPYFDYIQRNIDAFVEPDGSIRTYDAGEYNLDQINTGKLLFGLWRETGQERYKQAAFRLRDQLRTHPRTSERGFWHKAIYPHQMWLDGIYMQGPFYAEFARTFDDPAGLDDVAHQITIIEKHTRDPKTGLLYHGWDESKQQAWANPETGCSPHFWGRGLGWYVMAIPDVLDHLPHDHPQRPTIIEIFRAVIAALANVQDPATGLWYQVLDQAQRPGNYLEASASCMFVYGIAKGVRGGYLDAAYRAVAVRGYQGIVEHFVDANEQGGVDLNRICSVAGLGGNPYRDGSFEYYISEKVVTNDYKGVGAFILAGVEIERLEEENENITTENAENTEKKKVNKRKTVSGKS
jgi:unsaturated rhamnogalacturonyl hydrolase